MSPEARRPAAARPRAPVAAILSFALACAAPDRHPGVDSTPAAVAHTAAGLLADSASGDSAAFAALPASLRASLDVRRLLTTEAMADTARTYCQPFGAETQQDERRRLRFRLPDTIAVLFVRATRATGELQRVELVRRPLSGGNQQGFTWDAADDVMREVSWVANRPAATESGPLPRGGPAPRALRALGRLLLVAPCTGAPRALPGEP